MKQFEWEYVQYNISYQLDILLKLLLSEMIRANCKLLFGMALHVRVTKAQPGGGLKRLKPPLSDQNIDVYFLRKSRSGALQNVLWQYHRHSNTFVIKPSGYEFSRFEKY